MVVLVLCLVGALVSAALGISTYATPLEDPNPLYALFVGIFVTFVPAVVTHPRATWSGGQGSVTWRDTFRTAPRWAIGVFVAGIALALVFFFPFSSDQFALTREAFHARPERYRFVSGFTLAFYSCSTLIRASGLRAWANPF